MEVLFLVDEFYNSCLTLFLFCLQFFQLLLASLRHSLARRGASWVGQFYAATLVKEELAKILEVYEKVSNSIFLGNEKSLWHLSIFLLYAESQSFLWLFCLDDTRSPRKKWDRDWVESQNNGIGNETLVNFWDFFISALEIE